MKAPLHEIDPLPIQAVRLPLTAVLLWITPWARGTARTLWSRRGSLGPAILGLGALTAFSSVAYMTGLKYAGITLGTVLSSTAPLFALPIGLVAFGERITLRAASGAALCVTGISLLSL
jgi:drug/metabolite transporter (DMT)-like permease